MFMKKTYRVEMSWRGPDGDCIGHGIRDYLIRMEGSHDVYWLGLDNGVVERSSCGLYDLNNAFWVEVEV